MRKPLAEVNRSIRNLAAKVDANNSATWEFVCECGADACSERVGLELVRYDELKRTHVALLAPGHRLKPA